MQAVILAAGMGRRLGELTQDRTKCMIEVNGQTLIDRTLTQLSCLPLTKVILVIGHEGEKLKAHIGNQYKGLPIEYINNPVFDKTNNIYSLFLAKEALQEDDTLLLESDLIFEDSLLKTAIESPFPNVALVDKYKPWMDGTMVCIDRDNNISNFVPKKMFCHEDSKNYYKTVNIYKFSKEFSVQKYIPFLDAYIKAMGYNEYYEQVLRVITMLDKCDLKALPLTGQKWYEIDDIQDLNIAETLFAEGSAKINKMQRRYGGYWRFPDIIDFCYLVNPYFPTEGMKKELKANFDALLTQYPSGMSINSLLASKYFNIRENFICVGNGAAELVKALMQNLQGKIGITYPTFEEYPNRFDREKIIPYIPQNPDFSYTAEDLKTFFSGKDISTLLLINPDNPSGNFIHPKDILSLATWLEERRIRLILDESFVDFSDGSFNNTLLHNHILQKHKNLVVVKSISKSYGVPGLRLGIAAAQDSDLISSLRKDVSIWNINSFAEYYMQIFGKYETDYQNACAQFIKERARFRAELEKIPFLRVIPSQANYFLCELRGKHTSGELSLKLLEQNILIKDCGAKSAFSNKNYVRIAIRNEEDNNRLITALKKTGYDAIH